MAKSELREGLTHKISQSAKADIGKLLESLERPYSTEVMYLVVQQLVEMRTAKNFEGLLRQSNSALSTRQVKLDVKKIVAAIERNESGPVDKIPVQTRMKYVRMIEQVLSAEKAEAASSVDEIELKRELEYLKSVA
jgi:hypothetical protein